MHYQKKDMNRVKWIIIFIGLWSSINAQTKDREYYLDISKALGYSYGIELTNNLIQEKFTDLSKKAMMAQLEFKLAHEKAIIAMEEEISLNDSPQSYNCVTAAVVISEKIAFL